MENFFVIECELNIQLKFNCSKYTIETVENV